MATLGRVAPSSSTCYSARELCSENEAQIENSEILLNNVNHRGRSISALLKLWSRFKLYRRCLDIVSSLFDLCRRFPARLSLFNLVRRSKIYVVDFQMTSSLLKLYRRV